MSGLNNINQFGSLTVNGKKLTFEDFDKNNDNQITEEEYNAVLKEMKLDKVELSTVDSNKDKIISKEEFTIWNEKVTMQDSVNELLANMSIDLANKSDYIPAIQDALKDFMLSYIENYGGLPQYMASSFQEVLPAKYEEIKAEVLKDDKDTVAASVIYEIYEEVRNSGSIDKTLADGVLTRLMTLLNIKSSSFIKDYNGDNFRADLKEYLYEYLYTSDFERIKSDAENFAQQVDELGNTEDDLKELKEIARTFLTEAISKSVTIKLGGLNILTDVAIENALAKYTSVSELRDALKIVISTLSDEKPIEKLVVEELQSVIEAENRRFIGISGDQYRVDASLINYSCIQGYADGSQIHERGKGWSGSKSKAYETGIELLNNKQLKEQMKQQIMTMLSDKELTAEQMSRLENVIENVYNSTVIQTLSEEGMITGRGARGLSSKGHAYINIKDCVDKFITNFNNNISQTINGMNASSLDFDTADLDLSNLNVPTVNNDDIVKSYQTGIPLVTKKQGPDYYIKVAEQIIDKLKSQLEDKAKAMCKANGVGYNKPVFDTKFANIKDLVKNACVSGIDAKGQNWKGTAIGSAGSAVVGGATGFCTGTTILPIICTAVSGPVGWVIGGAVALVGIVTSLIINGGNKSQSALDTRSLVDGFTQAFAQDYAQWVQEQKNKTQET